MRRQVTKWIDGERGGVTYGRYAGRLLRETSSGLEMLLDSGWVEVMRVSIYDVESRVEARLSLAEWLRGSLEPTMVEQGIAFPVNDETSRPCC